MIDLRLSEWIKQIRASFEKLGITDSLTILESTVFLLLCNHFQKLSAIENELHSILRNNFIGPRDSLEYVLTGYQSEITKLLDLEPGNAILAKPSSALDAENWLELIQALKSQLSQIPPDQFLNHWITVEINEMQTGGRYPTPRHLTEWSVTLVDIQLEQSLADFACGSGGFLVAAAEKLPLVTGVEISPNWARLAFANCILHGIRKPDIRIGNSLSVFGKKEKDTHFDRVLMNPPFGARVDESLVSIAFGTKLSGRSETVLTVLALDHLVEDGKMVVFLPSGSLFANSLGEQVIRDQFIEYGWLSAVVTLPKDSFQPYSQVATHALLIEKTQQPDYINWFFQPRYDGFTSGRNRQPDPEHNDLPLITAAIHSRIESNPVIPLNIPNKGLAGYRVLLPGLEAYFSVERLTRLNASETSFLVSFGMDLKRKYYWIRDADVQTIGGQTHPLNLSLPGKFEQEITGSFFEGGYSLRISNEGGEIRTERKSIYSIHIAEQWDELAWMGMIVNADGTPAGPAFRLVEVPNRIKEADDTVIEWDYEIPLEPQNKPGPNSIENPGALILFPPSRLEGMRLSDNAFFMKSGKHYWLKIHLDEDNHPHFEIFRQEKNSSIFESDGRQCGVVFTTDGESLGVAVPSAIIQKTGNRDFQPSSYFPRKREAVEAGLESPAEILANIQKSQMTLSRQIGKLLSLAEISPASNETLPPHWVKVSPIGNLQSIQKTVWDALQNMIEKNDDEFIPKPFRITDIESTITNNLTKEFYSHREIEVDSELGLDPDTEQDLQTYVYEQSYIEEDLLRVLDLFERMGMIVRISIDNANYYRLVSEREWVKGNLP
ncbi:MAG: N-6 DNA methylase [Anaerolineaceae bacterium]|nr:N-6 DNA methylase [Anaerolineaceae bacterium]